MCRRIMTIMRTTFSFAVLLSMLANVNSICFPSPKTWWAKQVTEELHVTGRLTENQIKYAQESGYKSLISLFNMKDRDHIGPGELDPQPSTSETETLCTEIGLQFAAVLTSNQEESQWATESTLWKFSQKFESLPKPLILFGHDGYASAFIGLLYYLNRAKSDTSAEPQIDVSSFFKIASVLGYPYLENQTLIDLVLKIAEVPKLPDNLPKPELNKPKWYTLKDAWQIKPMYGNIYFCGQVQANHVPVFKKTGYNVFINVRKGVTSAGKPSQEESILLNIKDGTGTYNDTNYPVRQIKENLEKNRMNPSLPNSYISPTSQVNYQQINTIQFGDDVGYNETVEREALDKEGIEYYHMPIGGVYKYNLATWKAYRERAMMLARRKDSTLLIQCSIGYRSALLAMLVHGCLHGRNSSEVLARAYINGYQYEEDKETELIQLVRDVLDNRDNREKQCGTSSGAAKINLMNLFVVVIFSLHLLDKTFR